MCPHRKSRSLEAGGHLRSPTLTHGRTALYTSAPCLLQRGSPSRRRRRRARSSTSCGLEHASARHDPPDPHLPELERAPRALHRAGDQGFVEPTGRAGLDGCAGPAGPPGPQGDPGLPVAVVERSRTPSSTPVGGKTLDATRTKNVTSVSRTPMAAGIGAYCVKLDSSVSGLVKNVVASSGVTQFGFGVEVELAGSPGPLVPQLESGCPAGTTVRFCEPARAPFARGLRALQLSGGVGCAARRRSAYPTPNAPLFKPSALRPTARYSLVALHASAAPAREAQPSPTPWNGARKSLSRGSAISRRETVPLDVGVNPRNPSGEGSHPCSEGAGVRAGSAAQDRRQGPRTPKTSHHRAEPERQGGQVEGNLLPLIRIPSPSAAETRVRLDSCLRVAGIRSCS